MIRKFSRKERRALEARNRSRPDVLEKLEPELWQHLNRPGDRRLEVWQSNNFLVQVFDELNGLERLTISRTTLMGDQWRAEISWDDLQRLKRECGRGDADAVEIYPADRHLVNVANMRHLWIVPDGIPFKWIATALAAIAIAIAAPSSVESAPRQACVFKLPAERSGYWKYRLINGRPCWYGPSSSSRRSARSPRPGIFVDVVTPDQFNHIDSLCCRQRDLK